MIIGDWKALRALFGDNVRRVTAAIPSAFYLINTCKSVSKGGGGRLGGGGRP